MYAQQNALTFVCAHVALRTALSIALPGADISYKDINDIAGIDHVSTKVGRGAGANGENGGLTLLQIEAVLRSFNLNVPQPLINEPSLGHSFPDEYQKHLYGYIESGYPALVCFELTAKQSGGPTERHLIPVIGHTFNEDAWAPDAQRIYFGANAGYFPSEHWLSSYVIHDDNVGPYFCIPRHYMKQENFRAICGIQRVLTSLLPIQAETVGLLYVDWIRKNLPKIGKDWYDRFVVFAENQSLVLRTLLLNKADYLGHLGALKSRQGTTFEPGLMAKIASKIPEDIWMIEVSAPELFSCSRRKFGEIILPATAPLPPQIDLSLLVAARLPGVLILADQGQFPVDFSVFEGHSELYSRCS